MNLTHVPSREFVIIGKGQIPTAEVTQMVKELTGLSDKIVFSYLQLNAEATIPLPMLNAVHHAADEMNTAFCIYNTSWPDKSDWQSYQWTDDYLDDYEEDDLVVLWMLAEEPSQSEADFIHACLDSGITVLIANEGLWEVDRVDDNGLYEKLTEEVGPDHDVEAERTFPTLPDGQPTEADILPFPEPEISTYASLSKDELKVMIEKRGLKADRRSVHAMADALAAADVQNDIAASNKPEFSIDFDAGPKTKATKTTMTDGGTVSLPADADEAQERWSALEEKQAARRDGVAALADHPHLNPEPEFGTTDEDDTPMVPPPLTDEQATVIGERMMVGIDNSAATVEALENIIDLTDEQARALNHASLLATQLATVMVELKKVLEGE